MKGIDLTRKHLAAAEKFIQIVHRQRGGSKVDPQPDQWTAIKWEDLVRLVAHYGAVRAHAVANGGRVDVPGEPRLCG
jgi:hypothetical protein